MCDYVRLCLNRPPTPYPSQIALNDMEVSIENLTKLTNELQNECSKLVDLLGESAKLKLDVSVWAGVKLKCSSQLRTLHNLHFVGNFKYTSSVVST